METAELGRRLFRGNMPISPPKPDPLICRCGIELPWKWCPPIKNPCNGENFFWTNRWEHPGEICGTCADEKSKIDAKNKAEREAALIIENAKKREEKINAILGGERAKFWEFETFQPKTESQRRALAGSRSASNQEKNLYLWGKTTGTGKSHLAGSAFRNGKGVNLAFWKPGPLLRYLRVLDADEQEARIAMCIKADVFVLDDIGIGNVTDFSIQAFYEIIDGRWMANKNGMIITANLSLDDLAQKLGDDRLSSRIAGMSEVIEVIGPDMRLVKH